MKARAALSVVSPVLSGPLADRPLKRHFPADQTFRDRDILDQPIRAAVINLDTGRLAPAFRSGIARRLRAIVRPRGRISSAGRAADL